MRLSTSQSCSTSLLYTARMAARSVEDEQKQLELHGQQVSSAALSGTSGSVTNERRQQELNLQKLKEVEQQQSDFE